jgi:FixJ family two-component response regulator
MASVHDSGYCRRVVLRKSYIAIVDDEEPIRRALVRLLRSAGLEARPFATGVDFLESLAGEVPRCVVLDLHMPGMSGLDVQKRLERICPQLPVIFVTGHHSPGTQERALSTQPCAYLLKPINDRLLLEAIATTAE